MGTEESVDKSFFLELEDPETWLSTDVSTHFVLLFVIFIGLFVSNIRYPLFYTAHRCIHELVGEKDGIRPG